MLQRSGSSASIQATAGVQLLHSKDIPGTVKNSSNLTTKQKSVPKRIEILLSRSKTSGGFGFSFEGGVCRDAEKCRPINVGHILPGDVADIEGTMRPGDRIIEINGIDVTRFTLQHADGLLNQSGNDVILLIEYDVDIVDAVESADGPIVVEIDKRLGSALDIALAAGSVDDQTNIYVDAIYEAGYADRCGALQVGDQVLGIDGFSFEKKSIEEARNLLNANREMRIQLEILPLHIVNVQKNQRKELNPLPPLDIRHQSERDCRMMAMQNETESLESIDAELCNILLQTSLNDRIEKDVRSQLLSERMIKSSDSNDSSSLKSSNTPTCTKSGFRIVNLSNPYTFKTQYTQSRTVTDPPLFSFSHSLEKLINMNESLLKDSSSQNTIHDNEERTTLRDPSHRSGEGLKKLNLSSYCESTTEAHAGGHNGKIPGYTDADIVLHSERIIPTFVSSSTSVVMTKPQECNQILAHNTKSVVLQNSETKSASNLRRSLTLPNNILPVVSIEKRVAPPVQFNLDKTFPSICSVFSRTIPSVVESTVSFKKQNQLEKSEKNTFSSKPCAVLSSSSLPGSRLILNPDISTCTEQSGSVNRSSLLMSSVGVCTVPPAVNRSERPSLASCSKCDSFTRLHRTLTTDVLLRSDCNDFGLVIVRRKEESSLPVVSYIAPDSEAERCGVIQEGDRIVRLNEQTIQGLTTEQVMALVHAANKVLLLTIEFDVADSVVATSGVVSVKLERQRSGLGISISYTPEDMKTFTISHVQEGSIAHRIGTIRPGDKLLAADGVDVTVLTPDDITDILNKPTGLLQLTIEKNSETSKNVKPIHYTVELPTDCGPLGVTISKSPASSRRFIVSGITTGSIAEQVGALVEGDEVVAINGIKLHDQSLEGAMRLLADRSSDAVTLKIRKLRAAGRRLHKAAAVVTQDSIESSVESWVLGTVRRSSNNSYHLTSLEGNIDTDEAVEKLSSISCLDGKVSAVDSTHKLANDFDVHRLNPSGTSTSTNHLTNGHSAQDDEWSDQVDHLDLLRPPNDLSFTESFSDLLDESLVSRHTNSDDRNCESNIHNVTNISNVTNNSNESNISNATLNQRGAEVEERAVEQLLLLDSIFTPTPVELMKIVLCKADIMDNFGFSLSDGLYEKGVYISGIRPGGPASNGLKEFDKILQVNSSKVKDMDCHQVVRLIAQSGNRVELVISRNALASLVQNSASKSSTKNFIWQQKNGSATNTINGNHLDDRPNRARRKVNFDLGD